MQPRSCALELVFGYSRVKPSRPLRATAIRYGSLPIPRASIRSYSSSNGAGLVAAPGESFHRPQRETKGSPSEQLIAALKAAGHDNALPAEPPPSKIDHSYVDPLKFELGEVKEAQIQVADGSIRDLQAALALCIRHFPQTELPVTVSGPESLKQIYNAFPEDSLQHLQMYGFDVEDVLSWSWVITSASSVLAAKRLLAASNTRWKSDSKPPPLFLLSFLLRRPSIEPLALRLLLLHTQNRLADRYNPDWDLRIVGTKSRMVADSEPSLKGIEAGRIGKEGNEDSNGGPVLAAQGVSDDFTPEPSQSGNYPGFTVHAIMLIIIRLIRQARQCDPTLLPTIANVFCDHAFGRWLPSDGPKARELAFACNKILKLLGEPCASNPYLSMLHQQNAQTTVVEKMHTTTPPVLITREGFRAIAGVQLAHRKTAREQQWAALKSNSWPPWKEDRLGTDAAVDVESGMSRAMRALASQAISGYPPEAWDQAAAILAGWDTDGSPTIQTRRMLRTAGRRNSGEDAKTAEHRGAELLWASRVVATRTVNEAWAVFLSYQDCGLPALAGVYNEMLVKVLLESRRIKTGEKDAARSALTDDQPSLPGDGLELLPAPRDPRSGVYLRTPPPNPHAFLQTMAREKVTLATSSLVVLLQQATDFDQVVSHLRAAGMPEAHINQLLGQAPPDEHLLRDFPEYRRISAPFISALIRLSAAQSAKRSKWRCLSVAPWQHAIRLLEAWAPRYPPAWSALIVAVGRTHDAGLGPGPGSSTQQPPSFQSRLRAWRTMRAAVDGMRRLDLHPDLVVLHALCVQFAKVAYHGHKILARLPETRPDWTRKNATMARLVNELGLAYVKRIFSSVVGGPFPPPRPRSVRAGATVESAGEDDSDGSSRAARDPKSEGHVGLAAQRTGSGDERQVAADDDGASDENSEDNDGNHDDGETEDKDSAGPVHTGPLTPALRLSTLLHVPHFAHLHAFARALAAARDHQGLVGLLRWLRTHAAALDALAAQQQQQQDEQRQRQQQQRQQQRQPDGGARISMRRRVLVAARLGLEHDWLEARYNVSEGRGDGWRLAGTAGAPTRQRKKARLIVQGIEGWGGWPSDEEVEAYLGG